MSDIYLYNTFTKKTDILKPVENNIVKMYHCGPTVYSYPHIGNFRAYVFADTLRRTSEFFGYTVKQVINITDVGHMTSDADEGEDKMEKAMKKEGKNAYDIAEYYTNIFLNGLKKLNIKTENTSFPKATEYIKEQIEMIQELEKIGSTYIIDDGVYFNIKTFENYGKLGNINIDENEEGGRIAVNNQKKNPADFALWKFSDNYGEKRQQEWPSPWGMGFPGWHIECSAMSKKLLGETFDIHTGGIDHISVHHNNEIAQSESISKKTMANIWMHGAFINYKNKRIAKSGDGSLTLELLEEKKILPLSYRYFLLQSKYRQSISYDEDILQASQTAYMRLIKRVLYMKENTNFAKSSDDISYNNIVNAIKSYMGDDLNTAKTLGYLWTLIKDKESIERLTTDEYEKMIKDFSFVLGLPLN